jgi:hypothetical protein
MPNLMKDGNAHACGMIICESCISYEIVVN